MATQSGMYADPRQVYDADQDLAADVTQVTGVNRLRVEALLAGSGGGTVASRDADTDDDFNFSLVGFLGNSRLGVWSLSGGNWARWIADVPNSAAGRSVLAMTAAFVHAIASGRDTSPGAGSEVIRLQETRALSGFNAGATSLIGQLVAAHTTGLDVSAGTLAPIHSEQASAIGGQTAANVNALYVAALLAGIDTTGAATTRAVEVRGAVADQAYTLMRALTDAVVRGDDGTDYPAISARLGSSLRTGVDLAVAKSLLTGAILCGQDTVTNPTGDTAIPEVRQLSSFNAMATSVKGLVAGAYTLGLDVTGGVLTPIASEQASSIGGQTASGLNALFVAALLAGIDTTGAATTRAVEVRNFDATGDVDAALIGALVNARTAIFDATNVVFRRLDGDLLSNVPGSSNASKAAAYVNAMLTGVDNTGAAVLRQVEARNFDAAGDVAAALIGALVNARMAAVSNNSGDWSRLFADAVTTMSGTTASAPNCLYVNALLGGIDNTGAAVLRAVEARNFDASGDVAGTLIGALVNSRMAVLDRVSGDWGRLVGIADLGDGGQNSFMGVAQGRNKGYWASRFGRRFRLTDAGAGVAITNGFTATAPNLLIQAGATNEIVLSKLKLWIATAGTAPIRVRAILDPDSRYSSGGTSRTPANTNGASAATSSVAQARDGAITATAADADEREVFSGMIINAAGEAVDLCEDDSIIIPANGTLLLYVYGGAAAGTYDYTADYEDVQII